MRIQLPLALLVLPAAACVDSEPPTEDIPAEIEKENGGFTMDDELAMFGEEALYASAEIEPEAELTDELANDAEIVALADAPDVAAYDLLVLWGRMPLDPTADTGRDWSGDLRVSRGALVLRRRIAFDGLDRVLPRTERDRVEFRSVTRPHADGLAMTIYDPDPANPEPLRLTYTSADRARSHTLDLSRLGDGPIVVDAGDGNRVVAAGRRHAADPCAHGFMRGRWHALAPNFGTFLGVVTGPRGETIGHVRGIYGERRGGASVLFGKFIDRTGRFTGILNGTYSNGKFEARWLTRTGEHGQVNGVFFEGASIRAGVFAARWGETSCGR